MKECPVCGTENFDDANFCDNCGKTLSDIPPIQADQIYPKHQMPMPPYPGQPFQGSQPAYHSFPEPHAGRAYLRSEISGMQYLLDPRKEMMIGRGDRSRGIIPDIELSDNAALTMGVSRLHAKILFSGGTFFIMDLNSTNRTYINGAPLTPQQPYSLRSGDQIMLGNYRLTFILS